MKIHVFLAILVFGTSSYAFMPKEHGSLIDVALKDLQACAGIKLSDKQKKKIHVGCHREDTNYLRKALKYSHFYNPYREITARWGPIKRKTSMVRIDRLSTRLENESKDRWGHRRSLKRIGHMIHHVQDMAVPTHVIPILHPSLKNGFHDKFEKYTYRTQAMAELVAEAPNCERFEQFRDPDVVLYEVAKKTYDKATEGALKLFSKEQGMAWTHYYSWALFWLPDEGESKRGFGSYGVVGNSFGTENLVLNGKEYQVSQETYFDFYKAQARSAREASLELLSWFISLEGDSL